jgi:hypothetical protein
MKFKLSSKILNNLPKDSKPPLKTKENLEEFLQGAISFLQTQQHVLLRIISIIEEIGKLAPTLKADVIKNISKKQETESRKKYKLLRKELKALLSLEFNERRLFSENDNDQSFKLFKDASRSAPKIKQPSAPHYLKAFQKPFSTIDLEVVNSSAQALQEMVGQNDATTHDLQNSFLALATDPESQAKLKFFEEKVRSWVHEVIQGNDGLTVQANILGHRVDGLVSKINGAKAEE